MPIFITAYGEKKSKPIYLSKKSRTKQAHKDECDINWIVKKFHNTGTLEHARKYEAQYGFATSEDFHTSMNIITRANEMFEELPSHIRTEFRNDPAEFLDYVHNPDNIQDMIQMGLAHKGYTPNYVSEEDSSSEKGVNTDETRSDTAEKNEPEE